MKNVAKNPNFELRFKLLVIGMDKIYEIINHNRDVMQKEGESDKITEAKLILIENTCLLMDFIVNYSTDNVIYSVFKKLKNQHWLGDLIWSMKFTEKHIDLLDELTTKEFLFVNELMPKIMNDLPLPDYPYENSAKQFFPSTEDVKTYKKQKKERKLNKGPHLTDPIKFEL